MELAFGLIVLGCITFLVGGVVIDRRDAHNDRGES